MLADPVRGEWRLLGTGAVVNNQPKRNLWTVKEAAAYLHMSPSWLYKRVSAGEIPHCKIGSVVRFVPDQIELYADQLSTAGTSGNVIPLRKSRT